MMHFIKEDMHQINEDLHQIIEEMRQIIEDVHLSSKAFSSRRNIASLVNSADITISLILSESLPSQYRCPHNIFGLVSIADS